MPVRKVGNKYAIGSGKAMYRTKAFADRAYKAYLAKKHWKNGKPKSLKFETVSRTRNHSDRSINSFSL